MVVAGAAGQLGKATGYLQESGARLFGIDDRDIDPEKIGEEEARKIPGAPQLGTQAAMTEEILGKGVNKIGEGVNAAGGWLTEPTPEMRAHPERYGYSPGDKGRQELQDEVDRERGVGTAFKEVFNTVGAAEGVAAPFRGARAVVKGARAPEAPLPPPSPTAPQTTAGYGPEDFRKPQAPQVEAPTPATPPAAPAAPAPIPRPTTAFGSDTRSYVGGAYLRDRTLTPAARTPAEAQAIAAERERLNKWIDQQEAAAAAKAKGPALQPLGQGPAHPEEAPPAPPAPTGPAIPETPPVPTPEAPHAGVTGGGAVNDASRGAHFNDANTDAQASLDRHVEATYSAENAHAATLSSDASNLRDVMGNDSLIDTGNLRNSTRALIRRVGGTVDADGNVTGQLNGFQLDQIRRHVSQRYGTEPGFAQAVKDAIDRDMPQGAYVRARALAKLKNDLFQSDGMDQFPPQRIDPATGRVAVRGSEHVPDEQVGNTFERLSTEQAHNVVNTMQTVAGHLDALGDHVAAARVAGKMRAAAENLQAHFAQRLHDEGMRGQNWNPKAAGRFLDRNEGRMGALLHPAQMSALRTLSANAGKHSWLRRLVGMGAASGLEALLAAKSGGLSVLFREGANIATGGAVDRAVLRGVEGSHAPPNLEDVVRSQLNLQRIDKTSMEPAHEHYQALASALKPDWAKQEMTHELYEHVGLGNPGAVHPDVVSHLGDSVHSGLDYLLSRAKAAGMGDDHPMVQTLQTLRDHTANLPVYWKPNLRHPITGAPLGDGVGGFHYELQVGNPESGLIGMNTGNRSLPNMLQNFTHEVTHAATVAEIARNPTGPLANRLHRLLIEGRNGFIREHGPGALSHFQYLDGSSQARRLPMPAWTKSMLETNPDVVNDSYGLANVREFAAEAFSNPRFRSKLNDWSNPERAAAAEPKRIWDRVVKAVSGWLSKGDARVSGLLSDTLNATGDTMSAQRMRIEAARASREPAPTPRQGTLGFTRSEEAPPRRTATRAAGDMTMGDFHNANESSPAAFGPGAGASLPPGAHDLDTILGRRQAEISLHRDFTAGEEPEKPMVNIGLKRGDQLYSADEAKDALQATGAGVHRWNVKQSGTEPTLVATLHRELTPTELHALSERLGQDAIAQRSAGGAGGTLAGPRAADWGGKYSSDYFVMHDGRSATEHANAATEFNPSTYEGKQTVTNPKRNAYPGIYGDPHSSIGQLKIDRDMSASQELFGPGVTKESLAKTATAREPSLPGQPPKGITEKGRGSAAAAGVANEGNAARLRSWINAASEYPELHNGMVGWYVMDHLHDFAQRLLGPETGTKAYARLNNLMAMASPGSEVAAEIPRGIAAARLAGKGEFNKFVKYAGKSTLERPASAPPELAGVPGHPYHSTAQAKPMANYLSGKTPGPMGVKTSMYAEASGPPGAVQNRTLVGDAHWSRGVGLSDTRGGENVGKSVSGPELKTLRDWYREQVAEKLDQPLPATSAQAVQWGAMAHETGVETAVGAPKIELFARSVRDLAKRNGVSPKEMLARILKETARGL
jgi:hypothetical protein